MHQVWVVPALAQEMKMFQETTLLLPPPPPPRLNYFHTVECLSRTGLLHYESPLNYLSKMCHFPTYMYIHLYGEIKNFI